MEQARAIKSYVLLCEVLCVLCVSVVIPSRLPAAEPTYRQDVRPVLRRHCTVCHSEKNKADPDLGAGLALDSYAGVLKGGRVTVVKPGDAAGSRLVTILRHPKKERRMPLDADPLPDET